MHHLPDASPYQPACYQRAAHTDAECLPQEGPTDEAPTGTDEFHRLDDVAVGIDIHADSVADEGETHESEQHHSHKQHSAYDGDSVVELVDFLNGIDDIGHDRILLDFGGNALDACLIGVFAVQAQFQLGQDGIVGNEITRF